MAILKADLSKVTEEKARLAAKDAKKPNTFMFVPRFNMKGKKARIRLLPPWTDEGPNALKIFTTLYQHWNVSDSFKAPVTCSKHTTDYDTTGECEICDLVDSLRATKNPEAVELAKNMRAQVSYLYNIIDLDDPKWTQRNFDEYVEKNSREDGSEVEVPFKVGDPKIQVFAAKTSIHKCIVDLIEENNLDITDIVEGNNITITKTGEGLQTKYQATPEIKPTRAPVTEVNFAPNMLDKVNPPLAAEKVKELMANGVGAAAEEFLALGGGVKPPVKNLLAATKAAAKAQDVDEEEALRDAKADARKAAKTLPASEEEGEGALFTEEDDTSIEALEAAVNAKLGRSR
jgi:gp32 DNA binding protein like